MNTRIPAILLILLSSVVILTPAAAEDRGLHSRMSEAARERIRNDFRVEDTAEQTIVLYKEIVEH